MGFSALLWNCGALECQSVMRASAGMRSSLVFAGLELGPRRRRDLVEPTFEPGERAATTARHGRPGASSSELGNIADE